MEGILLAEGSSMAQPRYHFDEHGNYRGYLDDEGHYRTPRGADLGYLIRGGQFFDQQGVYRGHVDQLGRYYDEHGTYLGYFREPFRFATLRVKVTSVLA